MAHSNTSDSWGTAAVTVQQSSVPSSHWQHLPCKCILHPAFPIPIRNRRGGQPCWCTSWTITSLPILHSQGSAESPVTQLWGGTVHLNSSLCTPAHSWAFSSTQHLQQHLSCISPGTASEATWSLEKKNIFLSRCPEPPRKCLLFSVCRSLPIYQASLVTHHLLMLMLEDRATECKSGKAVMLQLGKSGASLSKYWHVCKQTESSFQQAALWLPDLMLDQRRLMLCGYELLFTEDRIQEWICSSCDDSGKLMDSQEPPAACPLPTCNTTSGCNHFSFWKNKLPFPSISNFQTGFLQVEIQGSLH